MFGGAYDQEPWILEMMVALMLILTSCWKYKQRYCGMDREIHYESSVSIEGQGTKDNRVSISQG